MKKGKSQLVRASKKIFLLKLKKNYLRPQIIHQNLIIQQTKIFKFL